MGFKFSFVCDLLSSLDSNRKLKRASVSKDPDFTTVSNWFRVHEKKIHGSDTDGLALLSCLLPELRPDRVFGFKEPSLVKVIGRCLLLGATRRQQLDGWKTRGGGDLGQCVEQVMQQAEVCGVGEADITVEEIDAALTQVAARCRFSAQNIRSQYSAAHVDKTLAPVFRRLSSRDAKWFTRILLRDLRPIAISEQWVLLNFHFLLPVIFLTQNSLQAALEVTNIGVIKRLPPRPAPGYAQILTEHAAPYLTPKINVKIGRPPFFKARSLKHCCRMAGERVMSLERKYDGEYCQIHVDLSRGWDCVRIFSKSGKDSTMDKRGIHQAIKDSLRVRKPDCGFSKQCILEGELLVWSDTKSEILPFHSLRQHVTRSGSFIGTENDSRYVFFALILRGGNSQISLHSPDSDEHLYMVFFDALLVDDSSLLFKPYRERRGLLGTLVTPIEGLIALAEQKTVDFSLSSGHERLKEEFSMVAAQRWEGLILKGLNDPYFAALAENIEDNTLRPIEDMTNSTPWIKFKREYIAGLGDTADFAIVGGRYDARDAASLESIKALSWTSYFVGCIDTAMNSSSNSKPNFRIVDKLDQNSMPPAVLQALNDLGRFQAHDIDNADLPFSFHADQTLLPEIEVLFRKPLVVEMSGSSFEIPYGVRYYTLRFARIVKIHSDRTYKDAVTFEKLQELAQYATSVPSEELSQEARKWAARLDAADGKSEYIIDHSEISTISTQSDARSSSSPSQSNNHCRPSSPVPQRSEDQTSDKKRKSVTPQTTASHPPESEMSKSKKPNISPTRNLRGAGAGNSRCGKVSGPLADIKNPPVGGQKQPSVHEQDRLALEPNHESSVDQNSAECFSNENSSIHSLPLCPEPGRSKSGPSHDNRHHDSPKATRSSSIECLSATSRNVCKKNLLQNSPILKFPVLLSASLSSKDRTKLLSILKRPKTATTTSMMQQWLASLNTVGSKSLPMSQYGIVLVNSSISQSTSVASEMTAIGNILVSLQSAGKMQPTGKIIFLHKKALALEWNASRSGEELYARWLRFGQQVFAGCIKWGYTIDPQNQFHINGLKGPKASATTTTSGVCHTVCICWDWKELLSILEPIGI
ncbi:hypothetical protein FQN57_000673 [Myotisia sp. PD_48]|nr:hypothetical protein FQN57_000673 [Myotisia sp. PD_48]